MTDIWNEKPKSMAHTQFGNSVAQCYHKEQMESWLEKVKAELDAILIHHITQGEEMQEEMMDGQRLIAEALFKTENKLEVIKSKLIEIRDDEIWTELPEIELAEELLKILEGSEFTTNSEDENDG